jgi:hypothetical protein
MFALRYELGSYIPEEDILIVIAVKTAFHTEQNADSETSCFTQRQVTGYF